MMLMQMIAKETVYRYRKFELLLIDSDHSKGATVMRIAPLKMST